MGIKKNFFAPLASGLGATRRAAMLLLVMMLTTVTAWATTEKLGSYYFTVETDAEGSYYVIDGTAALNALASYVNNNHDCSGKRFKQTADIAYSYTTAWNSDESYSSNYTPIGGYFSGNRYFKGTYDGQGHTISGIRRHKRSSGQADENQGIFGMTGDGAVIRGITLADASITGYSGTGGIVGYMYTGGTVIDCHVAANVTIRAYSNYSDGFGGIVGGNVNGTISYCTSAATLTKRDYDKITSFGGIVGSNSGTLSHNLAIGAVVCADKDNGHGAICGNNGGTLENNYYYACTVAGNTSNVGCGAIDDGNGGYTTADITTNDGAVALSQAPITFVDADGKTAYCLDYTVLTGAETTLSAGWYVVNSDISYTGTITLNGDVNIILADGKTMSVVPTTAGFGIFGYNDINGESYDLTIYGQTGQSGTLAATTSGVAGPNGWDGTPGYAFYVGGYTQHGGIVTLNASGGIATCISAAADVTITRGTLTANTTGSDSYGISAIGKLTISDGSVTANATGDSYSYGIYVLNKGYWDGVKWVTVPATLTFSSGNVEASSIYMQEDDGGGTINLSWTNATDRFKVTEYVNGTVTIADGKAFHNGSEPLSGTVTDKTKLNGKTLTPPTYSVTANRATTQDTEYWSTFYHPAAGYTADENTTVYQAAVNTTTNKVKLTAVPGREIPADKAVVLKSTQSAITLSRATTTQTLDGNELKGGSTVADGTVPYTLAAKGGTVGFYKFVGAALNPNKAHLEITAPAQSAPAFLGFEENTTAINEHELHESHELSGAWYSLDGRKLSGKPSAKGIYVRNGRKFIIK